jgi:hypothetical protein
MVDVERYETLDRRLPELVERNAAIEVGIGRNDRLGEVEKTIATRALMRVVAAARPEAAVASAASMASATASVAAAAVAAALSLLPFIVS